MNKKQKFQDWCLWNMRKLSRAEWDIKYPRTSAIRYYTKWWNRGLQEYWLNFIEHKEAK